MSRGPRGRRGQADRNEDEQERGGTRSRLATLDLSAVGARNNSRHLLYAHFPDADASTLFRAHTSPAAVVTCGL